MAFDQHGAGTLITPVLSGPLSNASALVLGHRVESVLALLTSGQHISGMELAGRTTAVGLATFAAEQIKGALDHRLAALEAAQSKGQSAVSAPELLAQFRQVAAQSASFMN